MLRRVVALTLSALFASRAYGQSAGAMQRNEQAVRAVVDSFYDAIRHERYDQATRFLLLEPFEQRFRESVRAARAALPHTVTAEELMASDSTMPRAVAKWQAERAKSYVRDDPFPFISYEYARVTTPDQLAALSPVEALARWLEAKDPRVRQREAWSRSNCRALMPFSPDSLPRERVLGIAFGDDSTAYVVLGEPEQRSMSASAFGMERVVPAHGRGSSWRFEPREELLGHPNSQFIMQCGVRR